MWGEGLSVFGGHSRGHGSVRKFLFFFLFFLILVLWRSMVRVRSTERACIWFLLHVTQELKVFGLLVDM